MLRIQIIRAKPNPLGRDRLGRTVPSSQLAGEWIDIKNVGTEVYGFKSIVLEHVAYPPGFPYGQWERVIDLTPAGSLAVNQTLRVHSGGRIDLSLLHQVDIQGAELHIFTGKSYVWNNDRSDTARLMFYPASPNLPFCVDQAGYTLAPREGAILQRRGNLLV